MNKLLSLRHLSKQNLHKSFSITTTTTTTAAATTSSSSSPSFHSHHLLRPFYPVPKPPTTLTNTHFLSPYHQCHLPTSSYGLFTNPVLSKHFATFAHLKTPIKSLVGPRISFLKTHFPKLKASPWSSGQKRGWSSWSQGYSADNIILGLIVANTGVFMLWRVLDRDFMRKNFMISVDNLKSGRIHTLITSAFSHISLEHIASNMIGLYFFGSTIGRVLGPEYLLKLYFAGAVVGSIFYVVHHAFLVNMFQKQGTFRRDFSQTPGLGASGAVNAIMLLSIFLYPRSTIMLDFIIPVPAILLGVFLVGKDILRIIEGDQQISGSAHLGGAAVAAVAWLRLIKGRGIRF